MIRNLLLKANLLLVLGLIGWRGVAGDVAEKRKTVYRSYPVTSKVEFKVSNQFGEVHLNTWDKSTLEVKVEIIVNGRTDERSARMLDNISVAIVESSAQIAFVTQLGNDVKSGGSETFEINYTVNIPAANPIIVENKFGDTYIDHRAGEVWLDISYGNLKTEDLTGFVHLDLAFGQGAMRGTADSRMQIKYADLQVGSARKMEMEQQFSSIELGVVDRLELESKYGDVEIKDGGNIVADAQFSGLEINVLRAGLVLEASYVSNFSIGLLKKEFSKVDIVGKFSGVEIKLEAGLKADISAEFSFASLDTNNVNVDFFYKEKDNNRSEYRGRIGGGDASRKISVRSSYGDLDLNQ